MTPEDWAAHLGGDPADYVDPGDEDDDVFALPQRLW